MQVSLEKKIEWKGNFQKAASSFGTTWKAKEPYDHREIRCFLNLYFSFLFIVFMYQFEPPPPHPIPYFLSNKENKDQTWEKEIFYLKKKKKGNANLEKCVGQPRTMLHWGCTWIYPLMLFKVHGASSSKRSGYSQAVNSALESKKIYLI